MKSDVENSNSLVFIGRNFEMTSRFYKEQSSEPPKGPITLFVVFFPGCGQRVLHQ